MSQLEWWQQAVIYQIAPMSFQNSNGDGKGDLPGIMSRLPYLQWLGIDAVRLCPIYPSPMADFGYDITDFCAVDPVFGTLADFDAILEAMHTRGIKLLLDFVPNHTSCQHPWFIESRASRDNPRRDWYVWADPARHGGPPNNWLSRFGGAWDESTGHYYYAYREINREFCKICVLPVIFVPNRAADSEACGRNSLRIGTANFICRSGNWISRSG